MPAGPATPSIVSMLAPSAWTANIVQLLRARPFTITVQAPQLEVSQPMWVPVRASCSRMRWTSRRRDSTSTVWEAPLTVRVMEWLLTCRYSLNDTVTG